jgi:hypothetical protein
MEEMIRLLEDVDWQRVKETDNPSGSVTFFAETIHMNIPSYL